MKKKKTILAALVLLLVVAVGGAIAYFTDTDTKTNTFTIGNVDISLTEDGWDALADANNNDIPDVAEDMMPGESVTKDPTINNLSTKNPAYVFAKVEVPCTTIVAPATTSEELFTYTTNAGWTELSSAAVACTSGGTATHVYYYGTGGTLTALAKAANAIVIAFNVRPVGAAQKKAELEQVEIKQYSIIYQVLEDVEDAMKGMLEPEYREVNIGNAEVRQTFKVSNVGTIAGCYVIDGKVERNAGVRVIREGVVIHDGKLVSLKRFKDDAKEVSKGFECGMQIEDYDDIKVGDTIEAYIQEEIKR